MGCKNKVMQYVPRGYGYREVESTCGNTSYNGERLMCDECRAKYEKLYPQGWRNVPGDVCKHGCYVGDAYGADYMCPLCEDGDE
jgi:hypothetical protein